MLRLIELADSQTSGPATCLPVDAIWFKTHRVSAPEQPDQPGDRQASHLVQLPEGSRKCEDNTEPRFL